MRGWSITRPMPPRQSKSVSWSVPDMRRNSIRGSRSETIGRRHEFGTDRIPDRLLQNEIDLCHRGAVDAPANNIGDRCQLVGAPRAPQCDIHVAAIEHPSHGEMDDAFAETLVREPIQSRD